MSLIASQDSFIKIIDNALPAPIIERIFYTITGLPFYYGEADSLNKPPVGLVCELAADHWIVQSISQVVSDHVNKLQLYRSYVNIFTPGENPFFHTDRDNGLSVLYYPNLSYDINQGGETSFYTDDKITGIIPQPGRIVIFPANVLHRANSFRNQHRFSIALKYI
jgi:hypothetical protein